MNKFIELTVGGEKHLLNTDAIFEVEPLKSGCRVYQTVYAPQGIDFTNVTVDESYEQVKAMLAGDTNVGDKNIKVLYKVTADIIGQAREICNNRRCEICSYNGHEDGCLNVLIADYLNGKLKGE